MASLTKRNDPTMIKLICVWLDLLTFPVIFVFFRWWELSRSPTWVRWPPSSTRLAGPCQCCLSSMTSLWVCCLIIIKKRCLSDGCTDDLHTSLLSDVDAASPNSDMWATSGLHFDMPVLEDWRCSSNNKTGRKWLQCWKQPRVRLLNGFPDAINCASTI